MPNGTYGGVRGKETKVGQKTFVSRPTRFIMGKAWSAACTFLSFYLFYLFYLEQIMAISAD